MVAEAAAIVPMAVAGGSQDAAVPASSAPMACQASMPLTCRPRTWPRIASPVVRISRSCSGSDAA